METIIPSFKDDTDKAVTLIMLITSIFGGFIPPLLVFILCKSLISENSYAITKAMLNLEIVILILWIALCFLNIIPILGQILCLLGIPCLGIANLIIIVKALISISKNEPVKIFVPLKLI